MMTIADVRDTWLQAKAQAEQIVMEALGEYHKPDILMTLGMMAATMGPNEQQYLDPGMIAAMQEVYRG